MQVVLNIDDEKFDALFGQDKEILNKVDIHEIFENCIKEYFEKDDYKVLKDLFERPGSYYNSDSIATIFTKQMINNCDMSKMQEVVDVCIEEIKKNYNSLLKQVIADNLIYGLTNNYNFRESISMTVRDTVYQVLQEMKN